MNEIIHLNLRMDGIAYVVDIGVNTVTYIALQGLGRSDLFIRMICLHFYLQSEKHEEITKILLSEKDPDCLHIYEFEGKGRGVVTSKSCKRGEFVVEYAGELIDPQTAQLRECRYTADENIGCYMYYFTHNDKQYW